MNRLMRCLGSGTILAMLCAAGAPAADSPSFDCGKVEPGSIEAMICADAGLAELDRNLASVYARSVEAAGESGQAGLKAEQRGWIKGRNDCWKAEDVQDCVRQNYRDRIAALQARYALVGHTGPVQYRCDGEGGGDLSVVFYETDPPSLLAAFAGGESLMFVQPSGSGARYVGRNESFWEHHGEGMLVWGYGAPELRCTKADGS